MKYFMILMMLLASTLARAEDVPVITRFQPSSPSYQSMLFFVKKLNETQTQYNFIAQSVPGAGGETADQRSLFLGRNGSKHVWYGPISSFTLNRFEIGNTYDRDNDFYFIRSFLTTYQSLVVSKQSNIKTLDELVTHLRNKDKNFFGVPMEIGAARFLNNIFVKHYNVNSNMIRYKDFAEISLALNNKELDYSIMTHPSVGGSLLEVEITKENFNRIPEFQYETLSSFAVPKELKTFGEIIIPMFVSLCGNKELIETFKKLRYEETCYNDAHIKRKIIEEVALIKKFQ